MYLFINARMAVHTSEVCHNVAASHSGGIVGGGFSTFTSAQLFLSESTFCLNRAEQIGMGGAYGGALYAVSSAVAVERCVFQNNTASGGLRAQGGAMPTV